MVLCRKVVVVLHGRHDISWSMEGPSRLQCMQLLSGVISTVQCYKRRSRKGELYSSFAISADIESISAKV